MMDCNGWSPVYKPLVPAMKPRCVDPIGYTDSNARATRFYDNGHYVGHDEPTLKFISSASGSGNHMTYFMQLAQEPTAAPTTSSTGTIVSRYAELSPAPWFGLPICDPNSYPGGPCTPDSDSNAGSTSIAGSAFMELQFYPPGFGPWFDAPSCDQTRYCAALNIDSLSCPGAPPAVPVVGGCAQPNPNCVEPVNFALLQTDGVPAGPQARNLRPRASFTPMPRP